MKPQPQEILARLRVDINTGQLFWINATKHHKRLNGLEAGTARPGVSGKLYWVVKFNGRALKRSHIVFMVLHGQWAIRQIDHINGNSLDDKAINLREVTPTQNAWNHKGRKKSSDLPMGVKLLASGKYQARIACNKKQHGLGSYETPTEASMVYQQKRKEYFGEYA